MIDSKTYQRYATDPAAFRADLIVDVDGVARRLGDVLDPWQRNDFAALDPALLCCAGRSTADAVMRAYLERPRGHSKTTDLAVTCCWALTFSTRPLRGYAYAADKDQARLLRDAMSTVVRLNPWLGDILTVEAHRVVNAAASHPGKGGTLSIEASDVGSSYGILPDLIIADELTHWQGDGSLWHSLISSAAKRSNCLMVVISNAGFVDSWQWSVREAARTDPAWVFSRLDGPQASWITAERLAEQRRMLPAVAYARLWENQWSTGGGDALTPTDIAAAFVADLQPMTGREGRFLFVAGVDLGLTRDSSVVVVLAVPEGGGAGRIRLAAHRLWRPVAGKKIDLMEVERHLLDLDAKYGLEFCAFDPWQAELLGQRLEADTSHRRRNQRRLYAAQPWMRAIQPTGANLRQIASLTIESFQDRRLQLYDCEPLRSDLLKLRVEEKSYGMRLVSPRDALGHGDMFSAFSLALLIAHELAGKKPFAVRSLLVPYSFDTTAPMPPAAIAFYQQQTEQQRLWSELERGGGDYDGMEGWREMMRHFGRIA
jgi:hypothetical protein